MKPALLPHLCARLAHHLGTGTLTAPDSQDPHALPPQEHHWRVLLVEDNVVNQQLARKILERAGYSVHVAGNGREALAALAWDQTPVAEKQTSPFDIILMDIQMPVMDGVEATQLIRIRERQLNTPKIPIIALTANALTGDREQYLAAGMSDYMSKPLDRRKLVEMMERLIRERQAELPPGPAGRSEPPPS